MTEVVPVTVRTGILGAGYSPFSFTVLVGWIVYGAISAVSFFTAPHGADLTPMMKPEILELLSSMFLVIGSALMIASAKKWDDLKISWGMDYAGMLLAMGGWIVQIIGNFATYETTVVGGSVLFFGFIVAIIVRFFYTYSHERFVKYRVGKIWKNG